MMPPNAGELKHAKVVRGVLAIHQSIMDADAIILSPTLNADAIRLTKDADAEILLLLVYVAVAI